MWVPRDVKRYEAFLIAGVLELRHAGDTYEYLVRELEHRGGLGNVATLRFVTAYLAKKLLG